MDHTSAAASEGNSPTATHISYISHSGDYLDGYVLEDRLKTVCGVLMKMHEKAKAQGRAKRANLLEILAQYVFSIAPDMEGISTKVDPPPRVLADIDRACAEMRKHMQKTADCASQITEAATHLQGIQGGNRDHALPKPEKAA